MPNIGRNADANSIGVVKRIDPPPEGDEEGRQNMTDGTEMMIVVVWKNAATFVPMPVMYMWCAHR